MAKKTTKVKVIPPSAVQVTTPTGEVVKAAKVSVIRDSSILSARIKAALKTGKELQKEIQILLVSACVHAVEHNNITPLQDLFNGTKKLCHENTVFRFIDAHAPVTKDKDGFKYSAVKAKKFRDDLNAYITRLEEATPYYNMAQPVNPFKGFDLKAEQIKLLKKAAAYAAGLKPNEEPLTDEEMAKVHVDPVMLKQISKIVDGAEATVLH